MTSNPSGRRIGASWWLGSITGIVVLVQVVNLALSRTLFQGWRCAHDPVHAVLETAGAVVAIVVAHFLITFERRGEGTGYHCRIAAALVGMGLLGGFHALAHAGNNFVWLHSLATFAGGLLFVLVWIPRRWFPARAIWWPHVVAAAVVSLGVTSLALPDIVPVMLRGGAYTAAARVLMIGGGILMFAAAVRLVWTYCQARRTEDLVFILLCALFGSTAVLFDQASLWESGWWGWHVLRLLAYGVALCFVVLNDERTSRKAMDKLASKSQMRLRSLLDGSPDAVMILARDQLVDCNEQALKSFGYSKEEFRKLRLADILRASQAGGRRSREFVEEQVQTALRENGITVEWVHQREDGTTFPAEVFLRPVDQRSGLLQATVRDISRRKLAERRLAEAKRDSRTATAFRRAALNNRCYAIITTQPDGTISGFSLGAEQMLGYRGNEMIGQLQLDSIHDPREIAARAKELSRQLNKTVEPGFETLVAGAQLGQVDEHDWTYVCRGGTRLPVRLSVTAIRDELDGIAGFLAIAHPVKVREQAAQELEATAAQARAALDSTTLGIITVDETGTIENANPAAERIFGYCAKELAGNNFSMLMPSPYADQRDDHILRYLRRGGRKNIGVGREVEGVRKGGERFPMELTVGEARLDNRRLFTGTIRDITQQRQSQQDLQRARASAESANRAKSQFLAQMSHEIRTPLNSILGFTEVLRRGAASEEQQGSCLDTILTSGRHLLTLIDDILDLSKIEAGHMDSQRSTCSPHEIIVEVMSALRVRAEEKCIRLEAHWDSGVPETIVTDPARLRQVLINVVGNAIKFTDEGGVTLRAQIGIDQPEPRFLIEVHDTGIGIPEDQRERIFEPFAQADNSATRRFGGSGLGMTISRNIARALGGDITVESTPGKGTTFHITLETGPLDHVRVLREPPTEALSPHDHALQRRTASLANAKILLVEDGETNRQLIELVLKDAGAQVVCAENGQEGVLAASRDSFSLILMDIQMPVMDGLAATRELRQRGFTLPIIALTAHAMRGYQEKCMAAGCSGYLSKPVDIDELLDTVAAACSAKERLPNSEHAPPQATVSESITSTLPTERPEFRRIVEEFVEKLGGQLDAMRAALDASEWDKLASLAHWLKGTGGTIGFDCFTEPAKHVEENAKQGRSDLAGEGIEALSSLAERISVAP